MDKAWYDQLTTLCKSCGYYSEDMWEDGRAHPVCHEYGYALGVRLGLGSRCDAFKTREQVGAEQERRKRIPRKKRG